MQGDYHCKHSNGLVIKYDLRIMRYGLQQEIKRKQWRELLGPGKIYE